MKYLIYCVLLAFNIVLPIHAQTETGVIKLPIDSISGYYDSEYLHVSINGYEGRVIIRVAKSENINSIIDDTCEISRMDHEAITRIADLQPDSYMVEVTMPSAQQRYDGFIVVESSDGYCCQKHWNRPYSSKKTVYFNLKE